MEQDKFFKTIKEIRLSEEEKAAVRRSVLNFVYSHPVSPAPQSRPGFWSRVLLTNLNFASAMAILLLITILAGGGVAVGAEKALPGDVLYPVKVGLNEEVRGWLSISDESKADWEIARSQRRLEEAEELASKGLLNTETRAVIESNFEAHSEKVKERIAKFEDKENFNAAVDVSSNFETSLNAHQKILARLMEEETDADVKTEIKPIGRKVNSHARAAKESRVKNESRVSGEARTDVEASAEAKLKAAELKLAEAKKFAESAYLDAEVALQVEAKLKVARTTIDEGKAKLETKAYGEAFNAFQRSIRISQEAKLLIEARQDLNIDLEIQGQFGEDNNSPNPFNGHDDEDDDEENEERNGTKIEGELKVNIGL